MKPYKEFQPTILDPIGLCADVVGTDGLVVPCGVSRDSDARERSNFRVALTRLGGESETVTVHRFNHWACGWFEIIVVTPDTPSVGIAERIEQELRDYPILEDFSEEENRELLGVSKR